MDLVVAFDIALKIFLWLMIIILSGIAVASLFFRISEELIKFRNKLDRFRSRMTPPGNVKNNVPPRTLIPPSQHQNERFFED